MTLMRNMSRRCFPTILTGVVLSFFAAAALAQAPIINPGAPGQDSRELAPKRPASWPARATRKPTCASCRT